MTHSGNLLKESKRCRWRHRRRRRCRCCRRRLGVNLLINFFLHFLPWEFPGEEFWNILPRTIIGQRAIFDAKKMQDRLFLQFSLSLSFSSLSLGPIPGISHYLGYVHLSLTNSMLYVLFIFLFLPFLSPCHCFVCPLKQGCSVRQPLISNASILCPLLATVVVAQLVEFP